VDSYVLLDVITGPLLTADSIDNARCRMRMWLLPMKGSRWWIEALPLHLFNYGRFPRSCLSGRPAPMRLTAPEVGTRQ